MPSETSREAIDGTSLWLRRSLEMKPSVSGSVLAGNSEMLDAYWPLRRGTGETVVAVGAAAAAAAEFGLSVSENSDGDEAGWVWPTANDDRSLLGERVVTLGDEAATSVRAACMSSRCEAGPLLRPVLLPPLLPPLPLEPVRLSDEYEAMAEGLACEREMTRGRSKLTAAYDCGSEKAATGETSELWLLDTERVQVGSEARQGTERPAVGATLRCCCCCWWWWGASCCVGWPKWGEGGARLPEEDTVRADEANEAPDEQASVISSSSLHARLRLPETEEASANIDKAGIS